MKILITGASGFIGSALVKRLSHQGHQLVLVVHHSTVVASENMHVVNLADCLDWRPLLAGCDVVVHLAARVHVMKETEENAAQEYFKLNVEATRRLAEQAAEAGVKRFIYLSSLKVNGESNDDGRSFTQQDNPKPVGHYAQSKYQAEQILFDLAKKSALEVTVIRPPLVYGPNVRANFQSLLSIVHHQRPLPFAGIKNQRSFVYVENLVDFIHLCLDHPNAANECFLVSDDQDLSTPQLIQACAKALGTKARLFYVPQSLLYFCLKVIGKKSLYQRLCGDLTVEISKEKHLLGWGPPFSVETGLAETAKSFNKANKVRIRNNA